jgi:hypothetical protein
LKITGSNQNYYKAVEKRQRIVEKGDSKMKERINKIIIAKDGFPLEEIIEKPIVNFFRRIFLSSHRECKVCYEKRSSIKIKQTTYGHCPFCNQDISDLVVFRKNSNNQLIGVCEVIQLAEQEGRVKVSEKIRNIIAEFGDQPEQCISIIMEHIDGQKEVIR